MVKKLGLISSICLIMVIILTTLLPVAVFAQNQPLQEGEERFRFEVDFLKVEGFPGESFVFEVTALYLTYLGGGDARSFDLDFSGPKDWLIYVTPQYEEDKRIRAITIDPGDFAGEKVKVWAIPPSWTMPEPGDYTITLEATAGDLKGSVDLTAAITAVYIASLVPTEERYNTEADAGRDNSFSLDLQNNGTSTIDNITFTSSKPSEWTVSFSPEQVESLAPGNIQTINVNINPPPRTIAGDYRITLGAGGEQTTAESIDIRVTVETPTIWGWVGVGIIVLVVAGLGYIFIRFSRR